MLRIVTDGACDVPHEWREEFQIDWIPVNIHFDTDMYLQEVELDNDGFYRMVSERRMIPKTSQPSPGQFVEFYRRIAQPGDTILSMHITSVLSGTFASAQMAQKELEGEFEVVPFDTRLGSAAVGYMCREAREMDRAGKGLGEILQRMEYIRDHATVILTLNTLEYAKMSGRVKTLQAALASVLNVKPIAVLEDGDLEMRERVRTRRKALDRVIEMTREKHGDQGVNVAVVHAQDPESARALLEMVKERLNCKETMVTDLSISVAANLGPGTLGVIAYPV